MRRWSSLFTALLLLAVSARAEDTQPASASAEPPIPPLLLAALTKLSQDFDCWAYTETRNESALDGKSKGETVIRFDPSKPYAEQYTPVKIKGQPPTAKQLGDYRKRGEKRGERLARDEAAGKPRTNDGARFRLNGDNAAIDLAHATVESETETTVTFNIPLRNDPKNTLPMEKFEVRARINKERQALENVALQVRDSFRVKLIAKVKSGGANIDFSVVDPKFVPVMTAVKGEGTVSVMFVKFGGSFELKRTELQRVKPYSDRFGVQIGPLKALDF